MNQAQLVKRQERAATEPLVIQQVEEGFRVYAADEPKDRYIVSGPPNAPQCTCPDFQYHRVDPDWQCKHILAVLREFSDIEVVGQQANPIDSEERRAIQEEGKRPRRLRTTNGSNGNGKPEHAATLTLKRSVSPDGRIDSLSVEFSTPIGVLTVDEVRTQAEQLLGMQTGIVARFLDAHPNGNGGNGSQRHNNGGGGQAQRPHQAAPQARPAAAPNASPAVPARLAAVGGMDTRRGRRLFLTVDVKGRAQKLFGTADELIQHIRAAGYRAPERLQEGTTLNIPCLVITEPSPDGRFQNVTQVFPAAPPQAAQRSWQ